MVKDGSKLIMVGIRGLKFSVLILLLLGIPRVAGWTANFFDYSQIDPDGAFAWLTVHHVVQALLFVPLFALVRWVEPEVNFGLGWGNRQVGRQCLGRFIFWFSVYTVGAFVTAIATNTLQPFGWPLTDRNIWGQLGFQLFLSGPSEELIFRAFAITTFGFSLKGRS